MEENPEHRRRSNDKHYSDEPEMLPRNSLNLELDCRKGRGKPMPSFSRSSVKPARQQVCGTFFVTWQPWRREIRSLPRSERPSFSGLGGLGVRSSTLHALSWWFPTFLETSEDSHLTASMSTDLHVGAQALRVC